MRQQRGLDFTQFDAEAANLHLLVDAAEVVDAAVGPLTGQVAAAIQALRGIERARHEALGGEAETPVITPGQAGAGDVQLPRYTHRHRLQLAVEQVPAQVADRQADRALGLAVEVGQADGAVGDVHRGFGDAVHVDQGRLLVAEAFEPGTQARDFEGFAAENHLTQRQGSRAGAGDRRQLAERAGRLVQHRHALITEQAVERLRLAADVMRHDHQAPAGAQRAEQLPHREVEGVGMEQGPDIVRAEVELGSGGREQTPDVAMAEQCAFWPAGGTGGVDHVGEVFRGRQRRQVVGAVGVQSQRLQAQHLHAVAATANRRSGVVGSTAG